MFKKTICSSPPHCSLNLWCVRAHYPLTQDKCNIWVFRVYLPQVPQVLIYKKKNLIGSIHRWVGWSLTAWDKDQSQAHRFLPRHANHYTMTIMKSYRHIYLFSNAKTCLLHKSSFKETELKNFWGVKEAICFIV